MVSKKEDPSPQALQMLELLKSMYLRMEADGSLDRLNEIGVEAFTKERLEQADSSTLKARK